MPIAADRIWESYVKTGCWGEAHGIRELASVEPSHAIWQQDAYRMIQRCAADADIKTKIGNSAKASERSIVTVGFRLY
jgi:hypothetical protein